MTAERFQILALDGGGFKGMFPAALLACLEADLGIKVTDHFDLMTGASTGEIIALALGAGLKPSEITDFYVDQGPEIFGSPRRRVIRRVARSKYSSVPLRGALEEVFGEQTLAESKVALTIPAYDTMLSCAARALVSATPSICCSVTTTCSASILRFPTRSCG